MQGGIDDVGIGVCSAPDIVRCGTKGKREGAICGEIASSLEWIGGIDRAGGCNTGGTNTGGVRKVN